MEGTELKFEIIRDISAPKKPKPQGELGFGRYFTDHMLVMNYTEGKGWHDARIVPYGPITLEPSSMVLHYGQEVFEGLKAYRTADGRVLLFRPEQNARRMNASNRRLCMPEIDEDVWVSCVKAIVAEDRDWVPAEEGTSLYIRPFIFATDPFLGVRSSHTYQFMIILSPVGSYYPEGIQPVKIYIESEYVRAVKGGTGLAKCGGNYAASIRSQSNAHAKGYTQVLWLDGVERKYIEEVGTMNVFFKIAGEIVTPALEGSILPGITRDSAIRLLRDKGYTVTERRISIDELVEASDNGSLEEMFGTGTAAVISPVGELQIGEKHIVINDGKIGSTAQWIYDTLTGMQWGKIADPYGWTVEV
ncbi:MAG TPA: branched-chain amino acid aminotransferase [Clostridiales bacterium]|nr:branched-chain amino acid aminotransferase [Clostridiales bacterium]